MGVQKRYGLEGVVSSHVSDLDSLSVMYFRCSGDSLIFVVSGYLGHMGNDGVKGVDPGGSIRFRCVPEGPFGLLRAFVSSPGWRGKRDFHNCLRSSNPSILIGGAER